MSKASELLKVVNSIESAQPAARSASRRPVRESVPDHIRDMAATLVIDRIASELEENDEFPELERKIHGELTETVPALFDEMGLKFDDYLPLKTAQKIEAEQNKKWDGKVTVEEMDSEFPGTAARLALASAGHGVSPDDDQKVVDWLEEKGVEVDPGHHGEDNEVYDMASEAVDAILDKMRDRSESAPRRPRIRPRMNESRREMRRRLARVTGRSRAISEASGRTPEEFSVDFEGPMYSDYFQGASGMDWDGVYVGTGHDLQSAFEMALEDAAMDDWDTAQIEKDEKPSDQQNKQSGTKCVIYVKGTFERDDESEDGGISNVKIKSITGDNTEGEIDDPSFDFDGEGAFEATADGGTAEQALEALLGKLETELPGAELWDVRELMKMGHFTDEMPDWFCVIKVRGAEGEGGETEESRVGERYAKPGETLSIKMGKSSIEALKKFDPGVEVEGNKVRVTVISDESEGGWNSIRFEAGGKELEVYLDTKYEAGGDYQFGSDSKKILGLK